MEDESHSHAKYIIVIVLLAVVIVASLWTLWNRTDRLLAAEGTLAATRSELSVALFDAETMQEELTTTTAALTQARTELTGASQELLTTSSDLTATQEKLETFQADYETAMARLERLEGQSGSLQSDFENLQVNYGRMTEGYGYVMEDPTYQQMKSFLASDPTDTGEYDINSYVCEDFSADVKANAMKRNIRCAYVAIRYIGNAGGHAIVAFNTTDKGLIFIEPQYDAEVKLQVGKRYYQCIVPEAGTYYEAPDHNDTIERFNVIW